jgi:hypothetical protein
MGWSQQGDFNLNQLKIDLIINILIIILGFHNQNKS